MKKQKKEVFTKKNKMASYKYKREKHNPFPAGNWGVDKGHRTTYELYVGGEPFLNFETEKDAKAWLKYAKQKRPEAKNWVTEIKPKVSRNFKIGDMWRDDFDYTGMIRAGSEAQTSWGVKKLDKLFDSFEDVNYHTESEPLYEAIQELKDNEKGQAEDSLAKFREICKARLKEWGEK
jgi:hypothetical protein